jgi:polyhydroxyalkanoate synthesis regulator phasin
MRLENDWTAETSIFFEHTVSLYGRSYLVIFGTHINGGFLCVPNYGWGCEASAYANETGFNEERLLRAGVPEEIALPIAEYVDEWIRNHQEQVNEVNAAAQDRMMQRIRELQQPKEKKETPEDVQAFIDGMEFAMDNRMDVSDEDIEKYERLTAWGNEEEFER